MKPAKVNITLYEGTTFRKAYRWGQKHRKYLLIEGMDVSAPVKITVTGHGIPDGWPIWLESLNAPDELNKDSTRDDPYVSGVVDPDTLELKDTNGLGMSAFGGTGAVVYFPPVDLTNFTARMKIKENIGDTTAIFTLLSTDGDIVIDPEGKVTPVIDPADLTALEFTTGVYDLELVETSTGDVTRIAKGKVTVDREVTD